MALIRYVEFILKRAAQNIAFEQFHRMLHKMRKVIITDNIGKEFELLEDPPPDLFSIYQALSLEWPKKFTNK